MPETFRIKRGDTSPALRCAFEPVSVDLSGATIEFQMRPRRGGVVVSSPASIESFAPPIVRYDWGGNDTATPGLFEAEFRVTYADGSVETFPNTNFITVQISEDVR